MIYQLHFSPGTPPVAPFSPLHVLMDLRYVIRPEALPAICNEYYAFVELWQRPRDNDSWIGFTSCQQLEKRSQCVLSDRQQIETWLQKYDAISWCWFTVLDMTLSEQAEQNHPGIIAAAERLYAAFNDKIPPAWYISRDGAFRSYLIMKKTTFDEYMQWSYPRAKWLIDHNYGGSHYALAGYIVERMFTMWCLQFDKRVCVPQGVRRRLAVRK